MPLIVLYRVSLLIPLSREICLILGCSLQREMKEIKELRSKVAKLVSKLQEEAGHRQVSTGEWD